MATISKKVNLQRLINEQRPKIKPADIDGALSAAQVPSLPASKVTSGTLALARIPTLDAARIPSLAASKITSGTLALARIPTLDAARIPNLPASKITSGTFSGARLPSSAGGLNTYAFLRLKDTAPSSLASLGATVAGSQLVASNAGLESGAAVSGTWRVMGHVASSTATSRRTTVFLRIA